MGSLFDGQGSFVMLWENINGSGTCLWSSEIDKHAVAVAKYHFPEDEST
jgi:site-specific DNA-cytosine methylase